MGALNSLEAIHGGPDAVARNDHYLKAFTDAKWHYSACGATGAFDIRLHLIPVHLIKLMTERAVELKQRRDQQGKQLSLHDEEEIDRFEQFANRIVTIRNQPQNLSHYANPTGNFVSAPPVTRDKVFQFLCNDRQPVAKTADLARRVRPHSCVTFVEVLNPHSIDNVAALDLIDFELPANYGSPAPRLVRGAPLGWLGLGSLLPAPDAVAPWESGLYKTHEPQWKDLEAGKFALLALRLMSKQMQFAAIPLHSIVDGILFTTNCWNYELQRFVLDSMTGLVEGQYGSARRSTVPPIGAFEGFLQPLGLGCVDVCVKHDTADENHSQQQQRQLQFLTKPTVFQHLISGIRDATQPPSPKLPNVPANDFVFLTPPGKQQHQQHHQQQPSPNNSSNSNHLLFVHPGVLNPNQAMYNQQRSAVGALPMFHGFDRLVARSAGSEEARSIMARNMWAHQLVRHARTHANRMVERVELLVSKKTDDVDDDGEQDQQQQQQLPPISHLNPHTMLELATNHMQNIVFHLRCAAESNAAVEIAPLQSSASSARSVQQELDRVLWRVAVYRYNNNGDDDNGDSRTLVWSQNVVIIAKGVNPASQRNRAAAKQGNDSTAATATEIARGNERRRQREGQQQQQQRPSQPQQLQAYSSADSHRSDRSSATSNDGGDRHHQQQHQQQQQQRRLPGLAGAFFPNDNDLQLYRTRVMEQGGITPTGASNSSNSGSSTTSRRQSR